MPWFVSARTNKKLEHISVSWSASTGSATTTNRGCGSEYLVPCPPTGGLSSAMSPSGELVPTFGRACPETSGGGGGNKLRWRLRMERLLLPHMRARSDVFFYTPWFVSARTNKKLNHFSVSWRHEPRLWCLTAGASANLHISASANRRIHESVLESMCRAYATR